MGEIWKHIAKGVEQCTEFGGTMLIKDASVLRAG